MAISYVKYIITEKGEELITRMLGGLDITFKRIAIGDGYDYDIENFEKRTNLANEVKSLEDLTMSVTSDNVVELVGEFGKSDIKNSFWYREIGVYVVDPDNPEQEILYAYGNRNDEAEYITPDISNYGVLKNIRAILKVGNAANVNIIISTSQIGNKIKFEDSSWTLNEESGLYEISLGAIKESIKVLKNTSSGTIDTALVDIVNENNITKLRSLKAFSGCVISI